MQNVPNTQWWRTVKGQAALILVDLPTSPDKPTTIAVSEAGSPPTNGNEWLGVIQEAQLGKREFPNCVYFPSEGRELQPKAKGQIVDEPQSYRWVYRFSDSQKWAGSLESFLVAMDYRDLMAQREGRPGDEFTRFTTLTNRFLQGKQIRGVDSRFRVNVVAENGQSFGLEALSSGEKQILLMLGEIQRHLRPGGLLLIDEPEIHLHPRWQRLLVRALTELCTSANAQLILTTHSEEIASAVFEHELILLDCDLCSGARCMTAALTVRTVYVEGDDDLAVLTRWFPAAQFKKAGGKEEVRRRVEQSDRVYGVLDRDFATDAQVAAGIVPDSRLVILSRYCIENYLLEPDIITAALMQHPLAAGLPAESWLDEAHIRRTFHEWGDLLASMLRQCHRDAVARAHHLDRDLGFLRYFGPTAAGLPRGKCWPVSSVRLAALNAHS
jgi:hypothetical protein